MRYIKFIGILFLGAVAILFAGERSGFWLQPVADRNGWLEVTPAAGGGGAMRGAFARTIACSSSATSLADRAALKCDER